MPETSTVESVGAVLDAKNAEIAMWKKTHVDACAASAAEKSALESKLSSLTSERDALKTELANIAARVAKEISPS